MIQLAVPVGRIMDPDPLTVEPDDVLEDVTPEILDVEYRTAVVVDPRRRPLGLVGRSALVSPAPRKVVLVDHAEESQSAPGIDQAEIVEILDHHHIGSIETHLPVRATFDPVGSTATLVTERFAAAGLEPSPPAATMLLAAVLSDTVVLTSPTVTDRDRRAASTLGDLVGEDPERFGRAMFEASSDVSELSGEEIVGRDAKTYELERERTAVVGQVEVVGDELLARAARAAGGAGVGPRGGRPRDRGADGHRHRRPRHHPGRGGGGRRGRAGVRREGRRGRRDRAARRDEPQEAGRAEDPRRVGPWGANNPAERLTWS